MERGFQHQAVLYNGATGFANEIVPFVLEGVSRGEPTMVMVAADKAEMVRAALDDPASVRFVDMTSVGRNPARIIQEWQDFVSAHPAAPRLRGVGEPVWPGRSAEELVECWGHELLLNHAFADAGEFRLVCPYDVATLPESAVSGAHETHPVIARSESVEHSPDYLEDQEWLPFAEPLSAPPAALLLERRYELADLPGVRRDLTTALSVTRVGDRADDFVLAINEVTTNSIVHGGGSGHLRLWETERSVVCEVTDTGRITNPLVGRIRPDGTTPGKAGLWVVNQVCDLVQIRTSDTGTVVRMHLIG